MLRKTVSLNRQSYLGCWGINEFKGLCCKIGLHLLVFKETTRQRKLACEFKIYTLKKAKINVLQFEIENETAA